VAPAPRDADHEVKEGLVKSSGPDWTIVRTPKLTNGALEGGYRDGDDILARSAFPTLSRADVAAFMLRVAPSQGAWVGRPGCCRKVTDECPTLRFPPLRRRVVLQRG
jgi:hypothetical protein